MTAGTAVLTPARVAATRVSATAASLPFTGAETALLVQLSLGLGAAGGALLLAGRRRQTV